MAVTASKVSNFTCIACTFEDFTCIFGDFTCTFGDVTCTFGDFARDVVYTCVVAVTS
jgi:hypothetical protein